jgi:hypothetical protein
MMIAESLMSFRSKLFARDDVSDDSAFEKVVTFYRQEMFPDSIHLICFSLVFRVVSRNLALARAARSAFA